jgi:hypothetical protein
VTSTFGGASGGMELSSDRNKFGLLIEREGNSSDALFESDSIIEPKFVLLMDRFTERFEPDVFAVNPVFFSCEDNWLGPIFSK